MRYWLLWLGLLTGCSSYSDAYGNYNDVTLTPPEMRVISQDIALFLQQTDGARQVVNFSHGGDAFATMLTQALRDKGMGVSHGHEQDYLDLRYRIEALSPNQFHVTVEMSDGRALSRIWVVTQNQLVPLKTRAYGVIDESI